MYLGNDDKGMARAVLFFLWERKTMMVLTNFASEQRKIVYPTLSANSWSGGAGGDESEMRIKKATEEKRCMD